MSKTTRPLLLLAVVGLSLLVVAATATRGRWLPLLAAPAARTAGHEEHAHAPHGQGEGHDHAHAGHDESASISMSDKGLKNVGYEPFTVEPSNYVRELRLPAIVVERPGRSQIHITAPLTGVVTEIRAVPGEAVAPGQPLVDMRLTHDELVAAQRNYLLTAEKIAVVNRELKRLQSLEEGVIAGRRILEQEYEKQKLEAALRAERQAMLLHGLSEAQVDEVLDTRVLLQNITVRVPAHEHTDDSCSDDHPLQFQRLGVALGEHVRMGRELAVLSDHCELHIEGLAFEDDARLIRSAAEAGRNLTATLLAGDSPGAEMTGLELLYVADQIDRESRAFKFYLRLPNKLALDKSTPDGRRFIEWVYKPGQRMQIKAPVETWEDQLVLPASAVVDEGAEAYVYRQNGDRFDRVAVHVLHRDQDSVVIANDGALFGGDVIAGQGAYQMHLALKNKSGAGVDPHAGHSH